MKKIILTLITSLTFVISTPFLTLASPLAYPIERISGQDRVETALNISQKGWDAARTVILCEYSDYPDSIASTPFAVSLDAPILLTEGDSIDPRVLKELKRLKPQKVILLGGTGGLKPSIEEELEKILKVDWERIGGADRYETSILLAKSVKSDSLILANGDDFPDALSAATFAGIKQIPIVLTSKQLPDSVLQYIKETNPQHIIVIGGEGVIPSADLTKNNLKVETRLGGLDRYETNAKVVSFIEDTYETDDLFLASGITFPDAVAGTILASKYKAPLLLSEIEDIPPAVYTFMRKHMKIEPPSKSANDTVTEESGLAKVTASGGLNLRETPSSTGKMLVTIPEGTMIELIEQQGRWYKTTFQGKMGWVSADYVSATTSSPIKVQPPTAPSDAKTPNDDSSTDSPQKGVITASGGLNLRETPEAIGEILVTIPEGTTIELIEQKDQWYKTTFQSKTGWVFADYIKLITLEQSSKVTIQNDSLPLSIDLSVNGTVYILGGSGVISSKTQNIIEGKASSKYPNNLKSFPPLPSEIKNPETPSRGGNPPTDNPPPVETTYDPSKEVLIDPLQEIPTNALSGKTIMLDPGHGGPDTGAIGPDQTYEKSNTLAIALTLSDILKQAGAHVIFTRDKDISPAAKYSEIEDLQARVDLANKNNVDLFISIHNDSFTNPDVQGTSTYYSESNPKHNESLQLASSIESAVLDTVNTKNRGVKEAGFFVLRNTNMPAILLETAFISNPYEEARLQNPTFRKNVAAAIFKGIYNYYKTPIPKD